MSFERPIGFSGFNDVNSQYSRPAGSSFSDQEIEKYLSEHNGWADPSTMFKKILRPLWIMSSLALVLGLVMTLFFPKKIHGTIDSDMGIVQEINNRGSAQGTCEIPEKTIATALAVQPNQVESFYIGAICRWITGSDLNVEITYSWFESGTLEREKSVNQKLGFEVKDTHFQHRPAIIVRSSPQHGCGFVTNYYDQSKTPKLGVIQFWVQNKTEGSEADACTIARRIMDIALGEAL